MMISQEKLGAGLGFMLLIWAVAGLVLGCVQRPDFSRVPSYEYGPPADAQTLDYDQLGGLDPQTQKTIEERTRNNDLEFRVNHLETQVRILNQIIFGIRELRIGEPGVLESLPPPIDSPEAEL